MGTQTVRTTVGLPETCVVIVYFIIVAKNLGKVIANFKQESFNSDTQCNNTDKLKVGLPDQYANTRKHTSAV